MQGRRSHPLLSGLLAAAVAVILAAATPALAAGPAGRACTIDRATGTTIDPSPVLTRGYGVRWNLATNRITFMEQNAAGYYRVFTARPDGTDRRALDQAPQLPPGHHGAPYWLPSGRYVIFIAQAPSVHVPKLFGQPDFEAIPGFGRHDDLWIATADGTHAWPLTHDAPTHDQGVLLPVVSPDGRKIAWSARQPGGTYILQVADFIEKPEPHLGAIRSYQPGGRVYYEPGSFSSDSRALVYTSDQDSKSFWRSQIYRLDLAGGAATRLTFGNYYNEHPVIAPTPTGDWVVYMSTEGVRRQGFHLVIGTDWHAMRLDGSGAKRLTWMNDHRPGNPEAGDIPLIACTMALSPAGDFMLGDVQDSLVHQTGMVKKIHFTCP